MSAQDEALAALERGDAAELKRIAAILNPHLPLTGDAETAMHMTRTQHPRVSFKQRAYSHRWLTERGLPSQLPDELKPKAERLYPVVVSAVFVSANTQSPLLKPVIKLVQGAMCDAVLEAEADGKLTDSEFVKARMQDARARSLKQLLGVR